MRNFKTAGAWIVFVLLASGAFATVYKVDRTDDNPSYSICSPVVDYDCTLRGAITAANQFPGDDTIEFDLQPNPPFFVGILFLAVPGSDEDNNLTGDLDITDGLTIDGGGWITINATSVNDRVIHVQTADTVTLQDITISGGKGAVYGGGIFCDSFSSSYSDLRLTRVTVKNNSADGGGGMANWFGTVMIVDSLFTGNIAESNTSAIFSYGGLVALANTTISGNGTLEKPSIVVHIAGEGQLNLSFSTIAHNELIPSKNESIYFGSSGDLSFVGTIVEGECYFKNFPTIQSFGGSIESPGDTCQLQPAIDQIAVPDLALLPLADYGGPTLSHLPLAVSPAVDDPLQAISTCFDFDQRGMPRDVDGDGDGFAGCDAGAVERQPDSRYLLADGFESGGLWRWSSVGAR